MNAGGTMLRVYDSVRRQIMTGAFAPGERLDPARLAMDHNASITPVRDALHRLTGERLVESWQQEGFRQVFMTEAMLRDLYGWSADLIALALRRPGDCAAEWMPPASDDAYPDRIAALFSHIARCHHNREHWFAVENLNARLHRARSVEATMLDRYEEELAALIQYLANPAALRRALGQFHRRRLQAAPRIAALLRPGHEQRDRS